jgi:hypothetical protein
VVRERERRARGARLEARVCVSVLALTLTARVSIVKNKQQEIF